MPIKKMSAPSSITWSKSAALSWCLLCLLMLGICVARAADSPALNVIEIKALCVLNFAKYMNWPNEQFASNSAPITIGVVGDSKMLDRLKSAAVGKSVENHQLVVLPVETEADAEKCQILFLAGSGRKLQNQLLRDVKSKQVLTVGENDQFLSQGGIINFVIKEDRVRFDINADAAHAAGLPVSAKIMSLANNIVGKQ